MSNILFLFHQKCNNNPNILGNKNFGEIHSLGIQSPSENGNGTQILRMWLDIPCSSAENMTIDA